MFKILPNLYDLFMLFRFVFFFLDLHHVMISIVKQHLRLLSLVLIRFGLISKTSGTDIRRVGFVLDHNIIIIINTDKPLLKKM